MPHHSCPLLAAGLSSLVVPCVPACKQAAAAVTSGRRTACLIWPIMGKVPRGHTDVLLPRSGEKLTLLECSVFQSAFLTSCDSHSHLHRWAEPPPMLQVRKLRLSASCTCPRSHLFPRGILQGVITLHTLEGVASSLQLLSTCSSVHPLCGIPQRIFSALCIKLSQGHSSRTFIRRRMLGAEKWRQGGRPNTAKQPGQECQLHTQRFFLF